MPHSFAEASYSSYFSYASPSNRTKAGAAFDRAAQNGEYDSPGPGHYEIPRTFGKFANPNASRNMNDRFAKLYSVTGSIGPGYYSPVHDGFDKYGRQIPGVRLSTVAKTGSVRFPSSSPRFARVEHRSGGADSIYTPGPGSYDPFPPGAPIVNEGGESHHDSSWLDAC